jgi:CRISPR-associated protein Cas1
MTCGAAPTRLPIHTLEQLVLHGYVQITTQALTLCVEQGVGLHWLRPSGQYLAGLAAGAGQVQRRLRQFEALRDPQRALSLARALVEAKLQHQLGFLLRATRGEPRAEPLEAAIAGLRQSLRLAANAQDADALRGHEGMGARHYFAALSWQAEQRDDPWFCFDARSRRPPRDRFNALLSFGYALLYRDCVAAALAVGLDPAVGFFHRPRTAAYPLALDLQELFRVSMVDMPVLGAVHRGAFDPHQDFEATAGGVWLSDTGRKKAISTYERRKEDTWKHPVLGYSLSYGRLIELEARLLEKEWTGSPGLFARSRLR